MEIDEIDRKILEFLEKDARISYTDLAKKLSLSDVAVRKRIDKLVEEGVIQKFSVSIDYKKLGKPLHVFLLLKINPIEIGKIKEEIEKLKNVIQIFPVIGEYDLILEIVCKDIEELRSLTEEGIGGLKGISEIRALVVV